MKTRVKDKILVILDFIKVLQLIKILKDVQDPFKIYIVVMTALLIVLLLGMIPAEANAKDLLITWEHPETDIEGNPEDVSRITGYDIWYTLDDAEKQYAAWVPMDDDPNILESTFTANIKGEYCFQLATVTKDDGKSNLSAPVCIDLTEEPTTPEPGIPAPPIKITIIISGSANVEVEVKDATN